MARPDVRFEYHPAAVAEAAEGYSHGMTTTAAWGTIGVLERQAPAKTGQARTAEAAMLPKYRPIASPALAGKLLRFDQRPP